MEQLKFEDVLRICDDFLADPSKNNEAFEQLQADLSIRPYLTMEEKVVALFKMVVDSDKSIDLPSSVFTVGVELACLFDGLLAYTNIDTDIPTNLKIYESYDAIYQSGLADFILDYCERDYNRLVRLLERTLSYDNLVELVETMNGMDSDGMKQVVEEFKKFKEETDPKVLHDISDIIRFNDPSLYTIKEDVIDGVLEQVEKMDKLEKIKK